MRINLVNTYSNIKYSNIKTSFKGEFDNRVNNIKKNYSDISWWWSGEDEAKERVEREMRGEIRDLEKKAILKEDDRDRAEESLKETKSRNESLLDAKRIELETLRRQLDSTTTTVDSLKLTLSDIESTVVSLKKSKVEFENIAQAQRRKIEKIQQENNNIEVEQQKYESDLKKAHNERVFNLRSQYEKNLTNLSKEIDSSVGTSDTYFKDLNCPKPNGFGAIAGYKKEKEIVKNIFGKAVLMENQGKTVEVINGLILFGLDIVFSEDFAKAIANQFNCDFIKINNYEDDVQKVKNLKNTMEQSKETYEKSGRRTVIFIDKLEDFAPLNSRIVPPLKSFMDDMSRKYHATVIATSTNPEQLDDILIRTGRFDAKILLDFADENNIKELMKKTLDENILAGIDFDNVAKKIFEMQKIGKFRINQLKNVIANMAMNVNDEAIKAFEKQMKSVKIL